MELFSLQGVHYRGNGRIGINRPVFVPCAEMKLLCAYGSKVMRQFAFSYSGNSYVD
jgi:hypothetical protein